MADAKNTFQFELVSPERLLMDIEATSVCVPGAEGDFQVLFNHASVMSTIRPGVIVVDAGDGGDSQRIFVRGGFAEVTSGSLVVLAEEAVHVEDLSRADLEQHIQNAREDLEDAKTDEETRKAQECIARLSELLDAVN